MYGNSNIKTYRIYPHVFPKIQYALGLLFLLTCSSVSRSQNPKIAAELYEVGNYSESIKQYAKLVDTEPDNPEYQHRLGLSYLRTNIDPLAALDHLIAAERLGSKEKDLSFDLAAAYMYHLEYDEAIVHLERFKAEGKVNKKNVDQFERSLANSKAALDLIKYPIEVSFKNLGEAVNSPYPDYHPYITSNGQKLLFTSRRKIKPGSKPEFDGYYPSDILKSEIERGAWSEAGRLSDLINTEYDEQTVGLSASGDTLFYYIDHLDDFGDIFISTYRNSAYSNPMRLSTPINSPLVESACSISGDRRTMVFSSNRSGGFGQLDIWITERDETGNWTDPTVIDGAVNTTANEDFPSLSFNGNTLYFCSEGHPGMGGYDLFFSTRDTATGSWTNPQNLGYPINTPGDERTISFFDNQRKAVISAVRSEGYGNLDIYEITYTAVADVDEPVIFHLQVVAEGLLTPQVKIDIRNSLDETIGQYRPNTITGRFTLALYPGKYYVYVDAEGFSPYTEVWVVSEAHQRQSNNVKLINLQKK